MTKKETYAEAGVQVGRAEQFVERLKEQSKRSGHGELWKAAGGYACVYPVTADLGMAFTTDGVGTKLLVAIEQNRFDTIGIDLVAMCANDLVCVGARPNIFLDYMAVGKLEDKQADSIIQGIVRGCDLAGMILAGGETAEMPGLYGDGHFDLAGFAAGSVEKSRLLTGDRIAPGQKLIGVASTGIHSNGLSLARKVLAPTKSNQEKLLEPTAIYCAPVNEILSGAQASTVTGLVHVTGGGWRNLLRLNESVGFNINSPLPVPDVFKLIGESVEDEEMYKTFNMGMGLAVISDSSPDQIIETFKKHGFAAQVVGEVTAEAGIVQIAGFNFTLKHKTA